MRTSIPILIAVMLCACASRQHVVGDNWTVMTAQDSLQLRATVDEFTSALQRGDTVRARGLIVEGTSLKSALPLGGTDTTVMRAAARGYRLRGVNWISPKADTAAFVADVSSRHWQPHCYPKNATGDRLTFLVLHERGVWRILEISIPPC